MASLVDLAQQRQGAAAPLVGEPGTPGGGPDTPLRRPDLRAIVAQVAGKVGAEPAQLQDQVDRIVAAGHKMMYSPAMADERRAAIESEDPMAKRLAENVTGLLLLLDRKSQGGLPEQALFPAAMELLGEASEFMTQAGEEVTQDDFNEAARMMFALIGQKLGMSKDDLMGAAQQALPGAMPAAPAEGPPGLPPGAPQPAGPAPGAAPPQMPQPQPQQPMPQPMRRPPL